MILKLFIDLIFYAFFYHVDLCKKIEWKNCKFVTEYNFLFNERTAEEKVC